MRAHILAIFTLVLCPMQAVGQMAVSRSAAERASAAEKRIATAPPEKAAPVAADGLQLVVAVFRHGVRAPLDDLNDPKKPKYSQSPWPVLSDWGVQKWGDLTKHGADLAKALGCDYGQKYKPLLPAGSKAFLWADVDPRTRATANELMVGLNSCGMSATMGYRPQGPDPLFHPFKAMCGNPSAKWLLAISASISVNAQSWIESKYAPQFLQLYDVLACTSGCVALKNVKDNSAGYCAHPPGCGLSTIDWQGQFRYANTASETFLLEYANNMAPSKIGWGRVWAPPPYDTTKLLVMMPLHEFYFDQTQRDGYLARIEGSNLIKEIRETLNGENAPCQRITRDYRFAAFVGHDTNVAAIASLLGLSWQFAGAPDDTRGLPDNDPLPAGALVFELWKQGNDSFVRIFYVAQGLRQMRTYTSGSCPAFRVPVRGKACQGQPNVCEIPLAKFNDLANAAFGKEFLSRCWNGQQECP